MSGTVAVSLDGALGDTRPLWDAFLADAARRFAVIAPLEVGALPDDRREAAAVLDTWAEDGVGDWRRALERFAEDHAPVHLRPDPGANASLRRLRRGGARIVVVTDAPEPLARVALAHLGLARSVDEVTAEPPPGAQIVASAEDLEGAVAGPGYDQE